MKRSASVAVLARGMLLGVVCLLIGAVLLLVSNAAGYAMLFVGAMLVVLTPFVAAVKGAGSSFIPTTALKVGRF